MKHFRIISILIFVFVSVAAQAQTVQLIGTSEEFILENVKGYPSVEERSLEHEEFNILVFENKDDELSFYFTFFRGGKVCSYIKKSGSPLALKEDIDYIKSHFKNTSDNFWENPEKTIRAEIVKRDGLEILLMKAVR
ncbi:MAG: hypothetical protein V4721_08485 [Bacteroidota bacterium]